MKLSRLATSIAAALLAGGLTIACHDGPAGPGEAPPVAAVVALGGGTVSGVAGSALTDSVAVRVTDAAGAGIGGITVRFTALGGGSVSPPESRTDAGGVARTWWTLGTLPGEQVLEARAGDATVAPLQLRATVAPASPASIATPAGNGGTAQAGSAVPVTVLVADRFGNVVPGVPVAWRITTGGGSVTPAASTTDANGRATAAWTLGGAGSNQLTATAGALVATFNATGTPVPVASVTLAPDAPTVLVGDAVTLVPTPRDAAGTVLVGRVVTFGSADPAIATVTGAGEVRGVAPGVVTITATSEGVTGQARVTVQAPPPVAPNPPSLLTATATSPSRIGLEWQDNSGAETAFQVELQASPGAAFTPLATLPANVTTYAHTGLTPNTTYSYRVRACTGAACSAYSAVSTATTPAAGPSAPQPSERAELAVQLDWTIAAPAGVTGFRVYRRPVSVAAWTRIGPGAWDAPDALPATARSYVDGQYPLDRSVTYVYRVESCTASGCDSSPEGAPITPSPLAAPTSLTVTGTTGNTATITWADHSTQETGFLVAVRSSDNSFAGTYPLGPNVTTFTMTGMQTGLTYFFQVRAASTAYPSTPLGERVSAPTAEVSATPTAASAGALPGVTTAAPTHVTVSSATIGGTVLPNGSATTAWMEYGTSPTLAGATATPARVAGQGTAPFVFAESLPFASPTETYYYRAVALNAAGRAEGVTVMVSPTAPPVPTAVGVTEQVNLVARVTWAHDGSNGLNRFLVERRATGDAGWTLLTNSVPADARSYDDAQYSVDQAHTFSYRVSACNEAGCLTAPETAPITTSILVAPTEMTLVSTTANSATVSWRDNSTNESGFLVYVHSANNSFNGFYPVGANVTTFTMTGLGAGVTYYYKVAAHVGGRPSQVSNEVEATIAAGGPSAAPTVTTGTMPDVAETTAIVSGTAIPNNLPTKAWFEVSTNASMAGADTTAHVAAGGGTQPFTYSATLTPLGGMGPTVYYFRAVAENSAGRTDGAIVTFVTGFPAAPTNVVATVNPDYTVGITWSDAAGAEVSRFQVWRRLATSSAWQLVGTVGSSSRATTDAQYPVDAPYDFVYRVEACSSNGCRSSVEGNVVSTTPLPAPSNLRVTGTTATTATVAWTDNSAGRSTGSRVYVRTPTYPLGFYSVPAGATTYTLVGMGAGQTYYFSVASVVDGRTSAQTTEVAAVAGSSGTGTAPTATTGGVGVVGSTSVPVYGTVTPNGLVTTTWVEYGTSPTLAGASTTPVRDAGAGSLSYAVNETVAGLAPNTDYYVRVVAQNSAGRTNGAIIAVRTAAPAAPSGVGVAPSADAMGMVVSWVHASAPGLRGFDIQRREVGSATWVLAGRATSQERSFEDRTFPVDVSHSYTYRVDACNDAGCASSAESAAVTTTPLAPPTNLSVTEVTATTVTVTWTDNSTNETAFDVHVHTPGDTFAGSYPVAAGATSFKMVGLLSGTTYYFEVRARNGARLSLPTAEVAAVPH